MRNKWKHFNHKEYFARQQIFEFFIISKSILGYVYSYVVIYGL